MSIWFMVAGNEPDKLKQAFIGFYTKHDFPQGMTLWRWKNSYWICAPDNFRQEIFTFFDNFSVIEFSSAPPQAEIEFIYGDKKRFKSIQP